jgi:hypothetical protein
MQFEKYENIIASSDKLEFQFTSEGPKGKIVKVIQFTQPQNENIYNLEFGNLRKNGSVDDEAIYGVLKGMDSFERVVFRKGVNYFGFMVSAR